MARRTSLFGGQDDPDPGFNLSRELERFTITQLLHYLLMRLPLRKKHLELIREEAAKRHARGEPGAARVLYECDSRLKHLSFS